MTDHADRERRLREGFSLTRRGMLGGALGAGVAAVAGALGFSRLARADVPLPAGRAFLFCYFPGGWDQLLLLDPRDPDVFTDAARPRTLIDLRYGEIEGVNGLHARLVRPASGPLVFGPLARRDGAAVQLADFADRMAVVRGLSMSALGHEVAYRYFLTATYPAGTSARGTSVATELVALMAPRSRPLNNLAVGVESYNDRYPGSVSALLVRNAEDLTLVLGPGTPAEPDRVERAIAARRLGADDCSEDVYDRRDLITSARRSLDAASGLVRDGVWRNFDFVSAATPEAQALRARYGFAPGDADHPGAHAALAVQAIKSGVSQVVSVALGAGTDTHSGNNAAHVRLLQPALTAFVALLDDLRTSPHPEGGTLLDHTTVVGFSEFARTPLFNSFNGRDHHQASSLMLLGAGIRGGALVGATSDVGMAAVPWDLENNRPSEGGSTITPEHIAATLLASAGVSSPRITHAPIRALLAG